MALDKVKQGVIADDAVGSSQIAPDTVVAADIGANAITASELADNAVDTDAIASNAVTTAKITDAHITTAKIADTNITAAKLNTDVTDGSAITTEVKPHIIPGVLYPAVSGNDINGTDIDTSHGSTYTYGELHTDGRKYYYTDIKGSKPIRDPRIGAHFGSQRHTARSLQLLEQETATHGKEVFSVDGREWFRAVQSTGGNSWAILASNSSYGDPLTLNSDATGGFLEITGFFNDINFISTTSTDIGKDMDVLVNGASSVTDLSVGEASVLTPLGGRYVSAGSLINGGTTVSASLGTTPKINTLKLLVGSTGQEIRFFGIELIAQDTSNRSNIQIPSQDVVSYGKKFSVSGTPHYDPFTTMSYGGSGTTASALGSLIDTDTSLGMDAWKAGTSNYHRPWNGGRIIKWVDSSGTIKTSVNMMPPNAQNIGTTASNAVSNAHVIAGTNDDTINFNTSAIDHSQAEVAKSWHWREFGNGNANGGVVTGSTGGSYKDFSMLSDATAATDMAFVMDDGLTSLSTDDFYYHGTYGLLRYTTGDKLYLTFIGTGISWNTSLGIKNWAQNLPYGTHILELAVDSSDGDEGTVKIDGVTVKSDFDDSGDPNNTIQLRKWHPLDDITFHQPKKPPIPENACVLADYMLMADFVPQTTQGNEKISKGSRLISASRDFFHDTANGTLSFNHGRQASSKGGMSVEYVNPGVNEVGPQLTWFGDAKIVNEAVQLSDSTERSKQYFDGSTTNVTVTSDYTDSGAITTGLPSTAEAQYCVYGTKTTGEMGIQNSKFVAHPDDTSNDWLYYVCAQVSTPIHTSHHYQTFETPFLHELIGGDRNMEQTNLVCSPDGKSWDEVTRDTSYLGNCVLSVTHGTATWVHNNAYWVFDETRGAENYGTLGTERFNKDFAIAHDRHICLRDGMYAVTFRALRRQSTGHLYIRLNGTDIVGMHESSGDIIGMVESTDYIQMQRGDYIQVYDEAHGGLWCHFYITRA